MIAIQAAVSAVRNIGRNQRQIDPIKHTSIWIGEVHYFAAGPEELEIGVVAICLAVGAVQIHDRVFPGAQGGAVGELPLAGTAKVIAQAKTLKIDGLGGGVVQLHPVIAIAAGRHDFRNVYSVYICRTHVLFRLGSPGAVVGHAGGGRLEYLPIAAAIPAKGCIHGQVVDIRPVD
jgi:hypothetical protein